MVDVLRRARDVLRPGGLVVDVQPAAVYEPKLAVARNGARREIGAFRRTPDADVVAAHRARREAVAAGWFDVLTRTRGVWRARYRGLAEVRWLLRQNANWTLDESVRRRLSTALRRAPAGGSIEVTRVFSLVILQRRR
jgi:hypothetical protein